MFRHRQAPEPSDNISVDQFTRAMEHLEYMANRNRDPRPLMQFMMFVGVLQAETEQLERERRHSVGFFQASSPIIDDSEALVLKSISVYFHVLSLALIAVGVYHDKENTAMGGALMLFVLAQSSELFAGARALFSEVIKQFTAVETPVVDEEPRSLRPQ